jgi:hypothetical protein
VRRSAATLLALTPLAASGLEPRFDHRDQLGPALELVLASDTLSTPGGTSATKVVPGLRLAFAFDPIGEGNELVTGVRLSWPGPDPESEHVRVALDARYRAYFGTEEWKTFLDVGLFAPLVSHVGLGPLVGLGVGYDFGRSGGLYAGATLATAFGDVRTTSFALAAGAQLRFD